MDNVYVDEKVVNFFRSLLKRKFATCACNLQFSLLLGVLCGECVEGTGVTVLLNICTPCNTGYAALIPVLSMTINYRDYNIIITTKLFQQLLLSYVSWQSQFSLTDLYLNGVIL